MPRQRVGPTRGRVVKKGPLGKALDRVSARKTVLDNDIAAGRDRTSRSEIVPGIDSAISSLRRAEVRIRKELAARRQKRADRPLPKRKS